MIELKRMFRPDALISLDTLSGVVFRREAEAHRFLIAGPAPFTGEVTACFRRADGITLVAAVMNGLTERRAKLLLNGGELEIEWDKETGHVLMTGPAEFVFDGEVETD